ncbi:MAG: hypothetical protein HYU31_02585 [Deltaproteobacteria bacterium]|nr:hypothetical protein [Deltaproteobacteria bacterium]MBI2532142.1 hypothetical protein [Deltaproteobacteria bacterium]
MGLALPAINPELPSNHGPLMVVGFLGTLIGLERAVALDRIWPYGVALLAGGSVLTILSGFPPEFGAALALVGSCLSILVFVSLYRLAPAAHFIVMILSAVLWAVGNTLWLAAQPFNVAAPWWIGFLVLMIAGERLQLSRVMQRPARASWLFHTSVAVLLIGLAISLATFDIGVRIAGAALLALALWLFRYDIAGRTVRERGLTRYMAVCLLCGYFWLAAAGMLWITFADDFVAGPKYDAMLHAVFVGFVFSMIFAHAPVIFPSVTGLALPFRRSFYLHLVLLHGSLLLRVGGDLALSTAVQQWGGVGNIAAVLLFLFNNLRSVMTARS